MTETTTQTELLPYDEIGGSAVIRAVVDRFYDLMDGDPRFRHLRELHGPDLAPMRDSLAGFLTAWLGGPKDWFAAHPDACIMSLHRQLGFGAQASEEWTSAMARALADTGVPVDLAERMNAAFRKMGRAMQAG